MLLIPTLLCPKAWEGMSGNEAARFCTYCKKQVHNLEAMSPGERLALLSSPAGTICARYQVAIRRPVKGKEESYYRHLLKYGAGVAVTGSVLLVLWEVQGAAEKGAYYRASGRPADCPMPREYYEECQGRLKGDVLIPSEREAQAKTLAQAETERARTRAAAELVVEKKILDGMLSETAPDLVRTNLSSAQEKK